MKIIIPACDKVFYEDNVPRFITLHNGVPLLYKVIKSLNIGLKDIIVSIYEDHNKQFNIQQQIDTLLEYNLTYALFDKANSQSETVAKTIKKYNLDEDIYIKDSDNIFDFTIINNDCGYVCVESLNNFK